MDLDNKANPEDNTEIEYRLSALSINSYNNIPESLIKPIQNILSNQYSEEFEGLNEIRKMLSSMETNCINDVVKSGIVPILIRMAYTRPYEFIYQVCWVLCNIGSGDSSSTKYLISISTLDFFDQIFNLNTNSYALYDQIVWALGNIAGDCTDNRCILSSSNIFQKLLAYADILPLDLNDYQANLIWAISNCVRGNPLPKAEIAIATEKYFIKAFLYFNDINILTDACWSLYYISNIVCNNLLECINISQKIVNLLIDPILQIAIPLFKLLGNIIHGCDNSWNYLNELNIIKVILKGITLEKKALCRESAFVISKLCRRYPNTVQVMIEQNMFDFLFKLIEEEDYSMKIVLYWVFCDSISVSTSQQIKNIYKRDWISEMVKFLFFTSDENIKDAVLGTIVKVLNCLENHFDNQFVLLYNRLQDYSCKDGNFTKNYYDLVGLLREKGFDRKNEGERMD
ncbi:hypothetical protein SteCoe_16965 [Stentor coeruleus]|uniref:Importin subunit alpha n=1 Tax=Stentor coeruleus TaxID=5963 RepID=A0A1R2C027_9CILI|nr:hypothetical protein SteCoe_16965 [Stentor coeruleus]